MKLLRPNSISRLSVVKDPLHSLKLQHPDIEITNLLQQKTDDSLKKTSMGCGSSSSSNGHTNDSHRQSPAPAPHASRSAATSATAKSSKQQQLHRTASTEASGEILPADTGSPPMSQSHRASRTSVATAAATEADGGATASAATEEATATTPPGPGRAVEEVSSMGAGVDAEEAAAAAERDEPDGRPRDLGA